MSEENDRDEPGAEAESGAGSKRAVGYNSSRAGRFMKLAGLTAKVSASYTGTRLKSVFQDKEKRQESLGQVHARNAERMARTLGELKGVAMKVGQMVSAQSDLLPGQVGDILASLQQDAPPVPFEAIESQIESELGDSPFRLFERFDEEPFASASIGQVHRARTDDGREVVVKVQYPGVERNVDSDLKNLKTVLLSGGVMGLRPGQLKEVFVEIRKRLGEELDYCREADNVRRFQAIYEDDPEIVVPAVVGERSAQRVITLELIECERLETIIETYDQAQRNRVGENLMRMYGRQIFEHRLLHADPNPGNFGFFPDGRIALFDYGCIKEIPEFVRDAYKDIVAEGLRAQWDSVDRALIQLGARVPDKPHPGHDLYAGFASVLADPVRPGTYNYGEADLHERMAALAVKAVPKLPYFKPPAEAVFIDRSVAGLYGMLRKLRATSDWGKILFPLIDFGDDEPVRA